VTYYIISFDRKLGVDYEAFHTAFVEDSRIERWSHHIKSNYIVGTEMSARELSKHFRSTALEHSIPTRHIVMEVDLDECWGWLPNPAWQWIRRQRGT
jgi:hypothetical protein